MSPYGPHGILAHLADLSSSTSSDDQFKRSPPLSSLMSTWIYMAIRAIGRWIAVAKTIKLVERRIF